MILHRRQCFHDMDSPSHRWIQHQVRTLDSYRAHILQSFPNPIYDPHMIPQGDVHIPTLYVAVENTPDGIRGCFVK